MAGVPRLRGRRPRSARTRSGTQRGVLELLEKVLLELKLSASGWRRILGIYCKATTPRSLLSDSTTYVTQALDTIIHTLASRSFFPHLCDQYFTLFRNYLKSRIKNPPALSHLSDDPAADTQPVESYADL